ncbi:MAG: class II aldolase/adducin family protein [Brevefilum sp.]|nr:class II aldolase/adducin family protein [Brevefilum sp.]
MHLKTEREAVLFFGKKLLSSGLVKGSGGNISLSNPEKTMMAVTPSGLAYDVMNLEDIVVTDIAGRKLEGVLEPTSEIAFHCALQNLRPDINAVVHTHSDCATALACLGWELPAVHYLVGFGGKKVKVAPYATYGTQELSDNICSVIGESNAVLMANHGLVCVGTDLKQAFTTAEMIEYVSHLYLLTKSVGEPTILNDQEMDAVIEMFKHYGK